MPIVSRQLVKLANREDAGPGMARWRIDGTDSGGRVWTHVFAGPMTQAEAEAIMPTVWPTEQVEDAEEQRGLEFVAEGGDPEAFARDDLTLTEWRRRVARKFWGATLEKDRRFLERAAPYIASFTANQIANSLGISLAKAQIGLDRAVKIRDTLTADMADVDAKAEQV